MVGGKEKKSNEKIYSNQNTIAHEKNPVLRGIFNYWKIVARTFGKNKHLFK